MTERSQPAQLTSNEHAEHELKIASQFFEVVESGQKPFEIRKGDRPFKIGDTLWLREVDITLAHTGREMRKRITFCLRGWGMESGYVALGLAPHGNETGDGWLPIETAPVSGKWMLGWWPEITDCAVPIYRVYGKWHCPVGTGYDEGVRYGKPTKWRPLPAPPSSSEKAVDHRLASDDIRDLACCDRFVRSSASEFCDECGYTNLDHLRKRSSSSEEVQHG